MFTHRISTRVVCVNGKHPRFSYDINVVKCIMVNGCEKLLIASALFRLSYFNYSDLQLFAIFIFEVDISETHLMTSAENSVSEHPQTPLQGGGGQKKPSYGHDECIQGPDNQIVPKYKVSTTYISLDTPFL